MYKKLSYIFSKRDKYKIALLLCIMVAGSFLELLGVAVFQPFVNIIMMPDSIQENPYLARIYQMFGCSTTESFLTVVALGIIVIYVVKNVYLWVEQDLILKFTYGVQQKLSTRLLTTYLAEPYTFHLNKNIAELQRSMQEDTTMFTQVLMHTLQLIAEVVVCVVLGVYLFSVSNSITVVIVGLLILCVILFTKLTKRFTEELGKQGQIYKGKLYQWVNQSLGGVKEVKVLNREEFFTSSYKKYYRLYIKGVRINRLLSITPKYMVEAVCMTGLLIAIIIKLNFGHGELENFIPQLATFAVAAFRLLPSVGRINEHVNNILYAVPSVDLIYGDLKGIEDYQEEKGEEEGREWNFERAISAKHVTYAYPNTDTNVLEDANCVIPKGKTVAFIGSSGAGKTTMADIILGLLAPQRGKILVDDIDVFKNLTMWHHQIGYIPQVIYLSDDTIRNNIAFGIHEDQIDEEAVRTALKKAQLAEFVDTLPDGLDTIVGDRGVRLSGGQRQRIGIARALYHDPEILVLDEATSALDNETETAVMEAIESLQGSKTMIIIAHRLTTIQNADIIYEVGDGKVTERSKEYVFGDEEAK
ncbi:ABC transporter ATP-binding protein [Gallintestinimicrobium sp.]|uniref:ABC transporter ATP-binding protein n=1 Tax=Gallintestinimicrobium sp. TaxID=2981655 RepID=UPI00307CC157